MPIAFLISPHLPTKTNSSGNDCTLAASRIVSERVAKGCTFLQPEIILKFVVIVEHGSSHFMRLYVVLNPLGGLKLGSLLSWALQPSGTSFSHSITCLGWLILQCNGSLDTSPDSTNAKSWVASRKDSCFFPLNKLNAPT